MSSKNANRQTVNNIAGDGYMTLSFPVTNAQIKALGSTPLDMLPAPGANYTYSIAKYIITKVNYTAPVFLTSTTLYIGYTGATSPIASILNCLTSGASRIIHDESTGGLPSITATQYLTNTALTLSSGGINPTAGGSNIIIYLSYRIVSI